MNARSVTVPGGLAVIGGGRMGEAIVAGLLGSSAMEADDIAVAEPDQSRRESLSREYGVAVFEAAEDAVRERGVVLFAVKPQVMDGALDQVAPHVRGALVVSIAAGVTCARIESHLPAGTAVVRVMPNTPALVGEAMSVISRGTEATAEQIEVVRGLFASVGKTLVLDEGSQDAATAISGSGPAYVALFLDALARAGVAQGLSRDVAQTLAVQTLRGTVEMIERTGIHPEQVIDGVASPGGTTIAAVGELERHGVRAAISAAVDAAVRRAKELGA